MGLTRRWALLFFSPPFFLLPSLAIPLYHSYYEVICLNPVGPLWAYCLFFSQWSNTAIDSFIISLGGSCVPLFSLGRPKPVCFPWASLALFLTLHSHGFLLNFLGFPDPITLSLILGVHGLTINPLLSLLSLLWACRDPFSLFHIIYYPWFVFSLFPAPLSPFTSSRPICLSHGPVTHYSCRLGLIGFLSICQLFFVRVAGLLLSTWTSKMAINNGKPMSPKDEG